MPAETRSDVSAQVLDEAEARDFFEARCRDLLGISAGEFLAAYDSGDVWTWSQSEHVTELTMLLPFAR